MSLQGRRVIMPQMCHYPGHEHAWIKAKNKYPGVSGYNFKNYCIILSEDLFYLTNSVDPDEMQH